MMNNIQNIFAMYNTLRQNPTQILGNLGIPNNIINNPQAVLQHLMNNGSVSQEQYNQAVRMARNFRK